MPDIIDTGCFDDIGGFHDPPFGWNPNGRFCGECTEISCENCLWRHHSKDESLRDEIERCGES